MILVQWPWQIRLFIIFNCSRFARYNQRYLLHYLLKERPYNSFERPVLNDTHTLPVRMNLALQQIIHYDAKNEVIVLSGWMVLAWNDCNLKWNPKNFGGIETIRVPSTQIWLPDILLYNR
ncbi:unnamed protein product [Adineta ricciae]|uniref:Neurotransmitter-gated ion-channel ligand-binding domain-containing protein n=1 Tax=Adineta ricciae TaxID=249248 RepID=A0A815BGH3_ADIRI|nr:unnamed protein product [Adineta ricciae]